MGWETRRGRSYYYTAEWVDGRCVKRYLGAGAVAHAASVLDRMDRDRTAAAAAQRRQERQEADRADAALRALCRQIDAAVSAALTAAGYHRHHRGGE